MYSPETYFRESMVYKVDLYSADCAAKSDKRQ